MSVERCGGNKEKRNRRRVAVAVGAVGLTGVMLSTAACAASSSDPAMNAVHHKIFKLDCTHTAGFDSNGYYTNEYGSPRKIVFLGSTDFPVTWGAEVDATFGYIEKDKQGRVIKQDTGTVRTWLIEYFGGHPATIRYGAGLNNLPTNWATNAVLKQPYVPKEDGAIFFRAPVHLKHVSVEASWAMAPGDPKAAELNPGKLSRASIECSDGLGIEGPDIDTYSGVPAGQWQNRVHPRARRAAIRTLVSK